VRHCISHPHRCHYLCRKEGEAGREAGREGAPLSEKAAGLKGPLFAPRIHFIFQQETIHKAMASSFPPSFFSLLQGKERKRLH
jgi:hypothetical protein